VITTALILAVLAWLFVLLVAIGGLTQEADEAKGAGCLLLIGAVVGMGFTIAAFCKL
jgi:hypothetical protein